MNNKIVKSPLKIDLHIHSIFSKHKDGSKVSNNTIENVDKILKVEGGKVI